MRLSSTSDESLIRLISIRKSYDLGPVSVEILKDVNLTIQKGEMVSIVGASGCGKSTLMNILGVLDAPTSGRYLLEGQETSHLSDQVLSQIRNRRIGFVFQQFHLLPRLTAVENVQLPLVYRGVPEDQRVALAREMLARVHMSDREKHRPAELSGGQQQRIAIARAIVGRPSILLADEPTGSLDTAVGQDIMNLFLELNRAEAITTIVITHDPGIARRCARQVRMKNGAISGR
ncbi:MAG: ABC transporter ATP-binding protein [Acidobacteriota bacterium]